MAGAKLILIMGHTRCGAVATAVNLIGSTRTALRPAAASTFDHIVHAIQQSADPVACRGIEERPAAERESWVNAVGRRNVLRVVGHMRAQSRTLDGLVRERRIAIVGTGEIEFLAEDGMNT